MTTRTCEHCRTPRTVNKSGTIRRHDCQPVDVHTFALPWVKPMVTKNELRRMHYQAEARLRKVAIDEARWVIRAQRLPYREDPVDVVLHWRVPNRVQRDGDGAQWQLSVVLDALVRERVIPDDHWAHVRHSGVTCHPPEAGMPGGMWLVVQTVGGREDGAA